MKATNQNMIINQRSITHRKFPVTDYNYQSSGCVELGYCGSRFEANGPSFRGISGDYFAREARHNFVAEAAFFGVIIMTAAVPILSSATALFHFLQATTGLI